MLFAMRCDYAALKETLMNHTSQKVTFHKILNLKPSFIETDHNVASYEIERHSDDAETKPCNLFTDFTHWSTTKQSNYLNQWEELLRNRYQLKPNSLITNITKFKNDDWLKSTTQSSTSLTSTCNQSQQSIQHSNETTLPSVCLPILFPKHKTIPDRHPSINPTIPQFHPTPTQSSISFNDAISSTSKLKPCIFSLTPSSSLLDSALRSPVPRHLRPCETTMIHQSISTNLTEQNVGYCESSVGHFPPTASLIDFSSHKNSTHLDVVCLYCHSGNF